MKWLPPPWGLSRECYDALRAFLRNGGMNAGMLGNTRWSYRPTTNLREGAPQRTNLT